MIPARFERATRSLEGCCSIQLSYGTIGKTAPCGDDLRRKDRNFFHNSPRLNEKYHFPQGCNGLQPRGNPVRGTTLHSLSHQLIPHPLKGAQIVQLEGGITLSTSETFANEILEKFAKNYETIAQYLPLPVLFDSKEVKEMVYRDRHIKRVLELGRNANIAIFSVGTVRDNALFFRLGYADAQEKAYLKSHAVGDICSRFFDKDGNISSQELNDRTVGIALDDLRNKEYSILLSGGEGKIASIRAALKGGYANVLITDQFTAKRLLEKV